MKIGIINDTHDRGRNSANRLGDMHKDFMKKLDECIKIFKDCDFVIHLGDVWDSPNVSNSVIDDWLDKIEESKKKWYILPGNHDMVGARWETSQNTTLSHAFRRCKSIEMLEEISLPKEKIYIKGYPYYFNCEKDIKEKGLKHNKKDYFTIACTHSFISIKPFHPEVTHVEAKDIDTNYDVVLCSHFHTIFDETVNGTRFFNNGAWGRLSVTEATHEPQVSKFDTETKEIEVFKLKSAKMGEEIFDLTKIKQIKSNDKNLKLFIKALESCKFQSNNITENIERLVEEKKVDRNIADLIIEKIQEFDNES